MSFAIHCGVEKMMSAVRQIFLRSEAGISPVKSWRSAKSSGSCSLKDSRCCSTRGLVGARIRVFVAGCSCIRCAASMMAMRVLPTPVGRTTNVFARLAVSRIACW